MSGIGPSAPVTPALLKAPPSRPNRSNARDTSVIALLLDISRHRERVAAPGFDGVGVLSQQV